MTAEQTRVPADSPEQRRRRTLVRKPVFTVDMAGPDIQRRFLANQRLYFAFQVSIGLAGMCLAALILPRPGLDLLWPLAGGAAFLLVLSVVSRLRMRWLQALTFSAGMAAVGLAVGWALPQGQDLMNRLLNPAVAIGGLLVGLAINSYVFRRERSRWAEFLLTGPWLAGGLAVLWFFPAGEWLLGISGLVGLLLTYCALRAGDEAMPVYEPSQSMAAAADVVPLACIASFRWLWGRD